MTNHKVVKEKLFNEVVIDLDKTDLIFQQNGFKGTLGIETQSGWKFITGAHGPDDYEDEYGFKLVKEY